jgi:integrase
MRDKSRLGPTPTGGYHCPDSGPHVNGLASRNAVQEILGHAQITLTLDTYSHVLPSMQEGAVGRLGELLD